MAGMIEAKDARKKLGCDEATLQNYVNSGSIRAQRVGGKLMLNSEDVDKLAAEKGGAVGDDEGTIVLTGDSDDLSIDLGKVVDDSQETIVQAKGDAGKNNESITFGDELEVVSFDDNQNTSELNFDETKQTGQAGNLSFTDSNTAVMTAVDETAVGATTAPVEFQTQEEGAVAGGRKSEQMGARRSVRSQRAAVEVAPVHWIWPVLVGFTFVIALFFVIPYYVIGMVPRGEERYTANKDRALGADDNGWTSMAGAIAGFSVEPDKKKFEKTNAGAEYMDIKTIDPQAEWRYKAFRTVDGKEYPEGVDRVNNFVIEKIDAEKKRAIGANGVSFPMVDKQTPVAQGEAIVEPQVQIWKDQQ